MVDQVLKNGGVEDGLRRKGLAGDGRADYGENPRADDGPNPQRRERPWPQRLLQPVLRLLRFRDQLVDGLFGEKLTGQKRLPVDN